MSDSGAAISRMVKEPSMLGAASAAEALPAPGEGRDFADKSRKVGGGVCHGDFRTDCDPRRFILIESFDTGDRP